MVQDILGTLQSVGEKLFDNTFEDSLNLPHSTKTILREIGATNGLDKGGKVMDIIALVKANGSNVMGANKVRGYVREFASQEEYDEYYKDGIKNVYGLDFDEPKYTIPTKGTVSLSDYVTGTNPNVGENVGGQNFGDVVMQSTNGGYINFASVVGAQPNADLLVSSVRFGAMVASGISTIIDTLAQTQTTDFANYKNVVNMSANLIERFNTYYTNQEAQLDAFFSALVLLNPSDPSQQQLLGQLRAIYPFGYTQETWNALSGHADLKYQAIYDYLKGIETRNVYATGDYINLYLFNGMGAMLKLYEQPAA